MYRPTRFRDCSSDCCWGELDLGGCTWASEQTCAGGSTQAAT